jgi:pimeloyl-ACP methyl ester carboxylesterase
MKKLLSRCVYLRVLLVLLVSLVPNLLSAADLEREKRLSDQIVDAIFDGDPFFLNADGHEFLSIYMEAAEPSKRAVLLIHGRGYHPDWENVTRPLRVGLTEHGWNTLSIQMPVLDKEARFYEYVPIFPEGLPRIDAALAYLKEQGNDEVVMLAHSCGVHMAMAWIRANGSEAIDGFVGIGMGATDYKQPMLEPFPFERLQVPVLDLYGALDYPAVLHGADERWQAIQKHGQPASRQIMMENGDHYMREQDAVLVKTVSQWLNSSIGAR